MLRYHGENHLKHVYSVQWYYFWMVSVLRIGLTTTPVSRNLLPVVVLRVVLLIIIWTILYKWNHISSWAGLGSEMYAQRKLSSKVKPLELTVIILSGFLLVKLLSDFVPQSMDKDVRSNQTLQLLLSFQPDSPPPPQGCQQSVSGYERHHMLFKSMPVLADQGQPCGA